MKMFRLNNEPVFILSGFKRMNFTLHGKKNPDHFDICNAFVLIFTITHI